MLGREKESGKFAGRLTMAYRVLCAVGFLPAMFLVMIYYVYVLNANIGSRASTLWILSFLLSWLEDVLVLQCIKIFLKWCVVVHSISPEVRKIFFTVKLRYAAIIHRKSGIMRDAQGLTHHFNPAVRAARMFPHLPLSRFLIALNDYDIPYFNLKDNLNCVSAKFCGNSFVHVVGVSDGYARSSAGCHRGRLRKRCLQCLGIPDVQNRQV